MRRNNHNPTIAATQLLVGISKVKAILRKEAGAADRIHITAKAGINEGEAEVTIALSLEAGAQIRGRATIKGAQSNGPSAIHRRTKRINQALANHLRPALFSNRVRDGIIVKTIILRGISRSFRKDLGTTNQEKKSDHKKDSFHNVDLHKYIQKPVQLL